jgi:phospholipase D1/2
MKGSEDYDISFNGVVYKVNKKIHDFRTNLFIEHFDLSYRDVAFPPSNSFWAMAWNRAQMNTQIYDSVFKVYPTELCKSWEDVASRAGHQTKRKLFEALKEYIKGHAVIYPYKFLMNENLLLAKNSEFGLYFLPMKALY